MTNWNRWPASGRQFGVGICLPIAEPHSASDQPLRYDEIVTAAQAAEANGFDSVWFEDHFLFRTDTGEEFGAWSPWIVAGAIAQATSRVQIGLVVSCVNWFNPGMVARMTETLEEVSNGRFVLGIGAGWNKPEFDIFDYPYDHRVTRFEEAITILDELLRTGRSNFTGQFSSTNDAVSRPRGPRAASGGPPILVGTSGERMLGLTAKYADAWNTAWHPTVETAQAKLDLLHTALAREGRDPATMVTTVGVNVQLDGTESKRGNFLTGTDREIADGLRQFRDAGFDHLIAGLSPCTPENLTRFAGVIKQMEARS
jgi:alkanesulfonate monooxygenase SsuD/methylene tetrahydromethanopterin reductase-like flavin-dependent oxidoreductase (luciferase family)